MVIAFVGILRFRRRRFQHAKIVIVKHRRTLSPLDLFLHYVFGEIERIEPPIIVNDGRAAIDQAVCNGAVIIRAFNLELELPQLCGQFVTSERKAVRIEPLL